MKYTDGNEPAFTGEYKTHNHGIEVTDFYDGLSQRDYACIKLKVPKTNKEWLNEIIVESRRNDLAGRAMQGILNSDHPKR